VKAVLLLEDGTFFQGRGFGAKVTKCGEVVFNTAMTGYQEILTDPSYHEQIVTMTYPLIGNYGTNNSDVESRRSFVSGFVVKENCYYPSNFRSELSLEEYFKKNKIIGLEGIDTRRLVMHIREKGAMRGIISSETTSKRNLAEQLEKYPGLIDRDIVKAVSAKKGYKWDQGVTDVLTGEQKKPDKKFKVVAIDYGVKYNILRLLRSHGCEVEVVPGKATSKQILAKKPDGVFLSNGPGDPAPVKYAVKTIKDMLGKVPIFGICLGHQLLGLALGARTYKLKFGHHGANHPVKNLKTGEIEITSQNHGFCVDIDSIKDHGIEMTHLNLNDNTPEGINSARLKAFSVQYHPEASPGPNDSNYLFKNFIDLMAGNKKRRNR
jgi:carbamoyl-phosphate synthase small subunit